MKILPFLAGLFLLITACEDVIDVKTPSEAPRLTIDALIILTDTTAAVQTVQVKASLTSSFFGNIEPAALEEIAIQNLDYEPSGPLDDNFVRLTEIAPGIYEGTKSTRFFTQGELFLGVQHDGQRYLGSSVFSTTPVIDNVIQGDGTLFSGDETEIIVSFTDNPDKDNFYLFDFDFNEYLVTEDRFYQGETFEFSYFYDDGVGPGQEIEVAIIGVDFGFYNYMNQVIEQADSGSAGPFQTPSATVRGNIINVTDIDNIETFDNVEDTTNFALGYFAVTQGFTRRLTIE